MIYTGLVSITFRKLAPEEIVKLVCKAGLESIEWGGDIHVPHGSIKAAEEVGYMTRDSGLKVAAYGSYYRTGCENAGIGTFESVLETAAALGAQVIRVWAGNRSSAQADDSWKNNVVEDTRRIADLAAKEGIRIAYEYHGSTLTDTRESAVTLLNTVDHENVRSCWQPATNSDITERTKDLEAVAPWLENIHVFHWNGKSKLALEDGLQDWKHYESVFSKLSGDHHAMLEFIKDDNTDQFLKDAETLKQIIYAR